MLIPSSDTPGVSRAGTTGFSGSLRQWWSDRVGPGDARYKAKAIQSVVTHPEFVDDVVVDGAIDFSFFAAARVSCVGVGSAFNSQKIGVGVEDASLLATRALIEALEESLEGQVVVYQTGRIQAQSGPPYGLVDPVRPGCSVSGRRSQWGTLGGIVESLDDGSVGVMTNAHVFGTRSGAVFQPGRGEPGAAPRMIGQLRSAISPTQGLTNAADSAWATLDPDIGFDPTVLEMVSRFSSPIAAVGSGTEVAKVGAASGFTQGVVEREFVRVAAWYGNRKHEFVDQYEIEAPSEQRFSVNGDSGSFVFAKRTGEPFAQLFAGVGERTWASPLQGLLQSFRVQLL